MQDLVKFLAQSLVDKADEVIVEEMEEDGAAVFELTVAEEDLGKVIGKQGRTARALRTILSAAASKLRTRAVLEILE
ncbi:MAG TPA: KH domain-containing protein [Polyangia bacterium]|nr:KH domain-containing protein [Polyangia bacterium]